MELLNHPFVQLVIVVTTGVCAGFLNTVAGGGSLLTLPVLIFLGLDGATMANGTNRVAIMIQNTVGVAGFRRKGVSDFRYGILIAIPAMIGAVMGALLVINLGKFDKNGVIFNRLLAIIMFGVLVITLSNPFKKFQSDVENLGAFRKILAVLLFFFLGIYMGFIQAGVGFMIIATLTIVNGFNLVRTNALKMFVVLFCTLVALSFWIVSQLLDYSDTEEIGNRILTKVEQISLMQFVNLIVVNLSEEWQQINSEIHARFDTLDVTGDELANVLQTCEVMLVGIETIVSQNIIENLWFCYTESFVSTMQAEQEKKREELDRQSRLRGDLRQDLVSTLEIVLDSYTTRIENRLDQLEAKLDRMIQDE